jgi:hypothetical protein
MPLAWYAEFNLKILLRKTGARLNFKITLIALSDEMHLFSVEEGSLCLTCIKTIFVMTK